MYVVAGNRGGTSEPDMVFTVGTNPQQASTYGKIINRVDMPNVGDEVHHIGMSHDKKRLLVPGVFSNRLHVFDLTQDPKKPKLRDVDDTATSGYITPHTVVPFALNRAFVTMVGAPDADTLPGGVIIVDDRTGAFVDHFGPGPVRAPGDVGPEYMYDFDYWGGRGISTTFGPPGAVAGGINPGGLGNTISIWDMWNQEVTQLVDLGTNSGALEVRFIKKPFSKSGYVNTPGTHAVWYFEDDDCDGQLSFHQVLGPEDGLLIPVDMVLSFDYKYMYITNWFGNTVQQFNIQDRLNPILTATVNVPHPNMLRVSTDGKRLYVTNQLLSTWDDDPNFGPPRNEDYGMWAYNVNTSSGGLTSFTGNDTPWISFENVQKKTTVGPAGPHMMLFDPAASIVDHH